MAGAVPQYGCWPLDDQVLLLRAALLDGAPALDAWRAWQRRVDLDRIDAGSFRLLPLAYHNLTRLGVDPVSLGRIRGVYRQAWYKNHLIIGRLADLLVVCRNAGLDTLVLKGVPLGLAYYKDVALRPMVDADVLVPVARAVDALEIVRAAGWVAKDAPLVWPPRFTASRAFANPLGLELDLHCHVLHECLDPNDDDDFWAASRPIAIGGRRRRALCPADQLLHVIAHGFRRSTVPPVRWVADAVTVIRASPDLDWDRLIAQARKRRLTRIAAASLAYVAGSLEAPIPAAVIQTLDRAPASVTERLERWSRSRPGVVRMGVETWSEYVRAAGREPQWHGPLGFARYARDRAGVRTWRGLVSVAAAKARAVRIPSPGTGDPAA